MSPIRARHGICAVVSLLLTGCSPGAPPLKPIPYMLDAGGVQLLDRAQRIDFGRTDHSTLGAMTKLAGRPPETTGLCPNGARFAQWRDGTALIFQGGDFRGWKTEETSAGLACR